MQHSASEHRFGVFERWETAAFNCDEFNYGDARSGGRVINGVRWIRDWFWCEQCRKYVVTQLRHEQLYGARPLCGKPPGGTLEHASNH